VDPGLKIAGVTNKRQ